MKTGDRALLRVSGAIALLLVLAAVPANAQEVPPPVAVPDTAAVAPDSAAADDGRPSPGGAFVRSLLVPGWGQASHDAYFRGGAFFALQAGSWFMLIKTMGKLAEARDIEGRLAGRRSLALRDSLLAAAAEDPERAEYYEENPGALDLDVARAVDRDSMVVAARELTGSRKQQREDWITMTVFVTLMSGVDALVNAHLSDFPARVDVVPVAGDGVSVGFTVPIGGKP